MAYNDDQNEIDSMSSSMANMDGNFDSSNIALNNNITSLRNVISSLGQQVGSVAKSVSESAVRQTGFNKENAIQMMGAMAGGPIGAAIANALSQSGIGERITDGFKSSISSIVSKFRSKNDRQSGMIDPSSMLALTSRNNSHVANEIKSGISQPLDLANKIAQEELHETKQGNVSIVNSVQNLDKNEVKNSQNVIEALESLQIGLAQSYSQGNQSLSNALLEISSKLNTGDKDDGIIKSMFFSSKIGTLFRGKYTNDISKSSNPLETQVSALLEIYRWQRLYGELTKKQLNQIIKLNGGTEQDTEGQHGLLKELFYKNRNSIMSRLGKDHWYSPGKVLDFFMYNEEDVMNRNRAAMGAALGEYMKPDHGALGKGSKLYNFHVPFTKRTYKPASVSDYANRIDGMTYEETQKFQDIMSKRFGNLNSASEYAKYLQPDLDIRNNQEKINNFQREITELRKKKQKLVDKNGSQEKINKIDDKIKELKKDIRKRLLDNVRIRKREFPNRIKEPDFYDNIGDKEKDIKADILSKVHGSLVSNIQPNPLWNTQLAGLIPETVPVTIMGYANSRFSRLSNTSSTPAPVDSTKNQPLSDSDKPTSSTQNQQPTPSSDSNQSTKSNASTKNKKQSKKKKQPSNLQESAKSVVEEKKSEVTPSTTSKNKNLEETVKTVTQVTDKEKKKNPESTVPNRLRATLRAAGVPNAVITAGESMSYMYAASQLNENDETANIRNTDKNTKRMADTLDRMHREDQEYREEEEKRRIWEKAKGKLHSKLRNSGTAKTEEAIDSTVNLGKIVLPFAGAIAGASLFSKVIDALNPFSDDEDVRGATRAGTTTSGAYTGSKIGVKAGESAASKTVEFAKRLVKKLPGGKHLEKLGRIPGLDKFGKFGKFAARAPARTFVKGLGVVDSAIHVADAYDRLKDGQAVRGLNQGTGAVTLWMPGGTGLSILQDTATAIGDKTQAKIDGSLTKDAANNLGDRATLTAQKFGIPLTEGLFYAGNTGVNLTGKALTNVGTKLATNSGGKFAAMSANLATKLGTTMGKSLALRMAGKTIGVAGGALTAGLDAVDAKNRSNQGDTTGALISSLGAATSIGLTAAVMGGLITAGAATGIGLPVALGICGALMLHDINKGVKDLKNFDLAAKAENDMRFLRDPNISQAISNLYRDKTLNDSEKAAAISKLYSKWISKNGKVDQAREMALMNGNKEFMKQAAPAFAFFNKLISEGKVSKDAKFSFMLAHYDRWKKDQIERIGSKNLENIAKIACNDKGFLRANKDDIKALASSELSKDEINNEIYWLYHRYCTSQSKIAVSDKDKDYYSRVVEIYNSDSISKYAQQAVDSSAKDFKQVFKANPKPPPPPKPKNKVELPHENKTLQEATLGIKPPPEKKPLVITADLSKPPTKKDEEILNDNSIPKEEKPIPATKKEKEELLKSAGISVDENKPQVNQSVIDAANKAISEEEKSAQEERIKNRNALANAVEQSQGMQEMFRKQRERKEAAAKGQVGYMVNGKVITDPNEIAELKRERAERSAEAREEFNRSRNRGNINSKVTMVNGKVISSPEEVRKYNEATKGYNQAATKYDDDFNSSVFSGNSNAKLKSTSKSYNASEFTQHDNEVLDEAIADLKKQFADDDINPTPFESTSNGQSISQKWLDNNGFKAKNLKLDAKDAKALEEGTLYKSYKDGIYDKKFQQKYQITPKSASQNQTTMLNTHKGQILENDKLASLNRVEEQKKANEDIESGLNKGTDKIASGLVNNSAVISRNVSSVRNTIVQQGGNDNAPDSLYAPVTAVDCFSLFNRV